MISISFTMTFRCDSLRQKCQAGMAVANALGANVQNVFLALAIPWTIQALFLEPTGEFPLCPGMAWGLGIVRIIQKKCGIVRP